MKKEHAGLTVTITGWNPEKYVDFICDQQGYTFPMKVRIWRRRPDGNTLVVLPENIYSSLGPTRFWSVNYFTFAKRK